MRNHISFMGKINRWQFNFFPSYIIPDIEFCPVADWKNAHIFSFLNFTIVDIPEFWSLSFRIPLSEFIPHRKYSFFGPRFFLISSGASNACIKPKFFDRIQQRKSLQCIATGKLARLVLSGI